MIERKELYRRRCVRKLIEVVDNVPIYWQARSPMVLDETATGLMLLASWLQCERDFLFQCLEEMGVRMSDFAHRVDETRDRQRNAKEDQTAKPLALSDAPMVLDGLILRWIDRAAEEARHMQQDYVGVEHLLLAFLRPEASPLAMFLSECGFDHRRLAESVLDALRRGRPGSREPAPAVLVVGMPKRFSIAIMMAWLTLFAMAFSLLKCVQAPPQLFGIMTVLMLGIGLGQMWLFGGNRPRLASVVAGAVVLSAAVAGLNLATGYFSDEKAGIVMRTIYSIVLIIPCVPLGAFFGYLLGALTAGIVLTLNYLENRKAAESGAEEEIKGG
jgi:hypothetical protein